MAVAPAAAVAGYVLAWLVLDELQIFDVAVHPRYRRRGVASQLLRSLLLTRCRFSLLPTGCCISSCRFRGDSCCAVPLSDGWAPSKYLRAASIL